MMNDPYSQITSGDRDNLRAEFDEQMAIIDGANNPDMIWVRGDGDSIDDGYGTYADDAWHDAQSYPEW